VATRDLFICHASENRYTHTRPLVAALRDLAISAWVDEGEILPGRSIIDAVSDGLRECTYVLVLITPEFLKPGWRQSELKAALEKELRTGVSRVVVVLADVSHDQYAERYPLVADKLWIGWESPEQVAADLAPLFHREVVTESAEHRFPKDFTGTVWTRVIPTPEGASSLHEVTIRWGAYFKVTVVEMPGAGAACLWYRKLAEDDIGLSASVSPPATLVFGTGEPPNDPVVLDINQGWTERGYQSGSPAGVR
jgi:hypothetical protein